MQETKKRAQAKLVGCRRMRTGGNLASQRKRRKRRKRDTTRCEYGIAKKIPDRDRRIGTNGWRGSLRNEVD